MSAEATATWAVVVPVKALGRAKTRLSTRPGPERRELALAFALDVVEVCVATPEVRRVIVVSSDVEVSDAVRALGAFGVLDPDDLGLNDALKLGARIAADEGLASPIALLAADLPALRAVDLSTVLAAAGDFARCFVSDAAGTGTTFVAFAPGTQVDPHFGPRSRATHAAVGFTELRVPELSRLRCDVDTEVDLWHAQMLGVGPRTTALTSV